MDRSAGSLAAAPPAAAAHTNMVSCIDCAAGEPLLVSASLDGTFAVWDLRRIGQQPVVAPVLARTVDQQSILKVALADSPYPRLLAVATALGLYAIDLKSGAADAVEIGAVITAEPFDDLTQRQFNDVRWGSHAGRPALFAACSDRPRVDVFYLAA
ncbi:hypothetical protein Rsub_10249 [Raphidocelis subcapitata]|uniref:Uncharacterized protein n=1 Tax=Raphidocelis subcapitata TaxID=307507 RepID=A0A2V0PDG9_9CHLO|nr:hypothetical protein Rsub_10249 [Raphidocelis subcapitata]|eukprot:GBF97894.1 hypothetical protein Rsub_10249 [Raphidocelis subcapitata]